MPRKTFSPLRTSNGIYVIENYVSNYVQSLWLAQKYAQNLEKKTPQRSAKIKNFNFYFNATFRNAQDGKD